MNERLDSGTKPSFPLATSPFSPGSVDNRPAYRADVARRETSGTPATNIIFAGL
jgi:hypothetical protein